MVKRIENFLEINFYYDKYFAFVVLFLFFLFSVHSTGAQQLVENKKVYKVAIDREYEPVEFVNDENKVDGLTPAILNAIEKSANVTFEFVPMSWSEALPALASGKVDIVNMIISPEREELFNFSQPYCRIIQGFFQNINEKDIDNHVSIPGHKIGFQKNDIAIKNFENRTDITKIIFDSKLDGLLNLNLGKIDGFFCSEPAGISIIMKYNFKNITTSPGGFFPQKFAFATRKDDQQLMNLLNMQLSKLEASGELQNLRNIWLSKELHKLSWMEKYKTALLWISGFICGTLIFLILLNRNLRLRVLDKTRSLKESEMKYRSLVENSPDAIVVYEQRKVVFVNNECLKLLLAKNEDELIGKPVLSFVHPNSLALVTERMKTLSSVDGNLPLIEELFVRLDGTSVPVEVKAMVIQFNGNRSVQLIVRDITERKVATQKAAIDDERIRILSRAIEQSPVTNIITDLEGNIIFVNPKFCETTGYSVNEVIGMKPNIFKSGFTSQEEYSELWSTIKAGQNWSGVFQNKKKNNELFWESAVISPVKNSEGEITHFLAVKEDITEQRKNHKALAESENHLKTIYNTEPECIKLLGPNSELLQMNPAGLAMLEAENIDQVNGEKLLGIINLPYRHAFHNLTKKVFKGEKGVLEFEITGLKGTSRWLESHAVPLKDTEGKIIALLAVTKDITERKKTEEVLIKSEEKYRQIVETAQEGIWLIDECANTTFVNEHMAEMLGYKREEMMGLSLFHFMSEEGRRIAENNIEKRKHGISEQHEFEFRKKNGQVVYTLLEASPIMESGIYKGSLAMITNISERKSAEEEVRKSQQELRQLSAHLNTIREEEGTRIAREIHDELGQQLTGLKMDTYWISKKIKGEDIVVQKKLKGMIDLIDTTVNTVRRIASELRPAILDDLGLVAALEWQSQEFEKRTGINCKFNSTIDEVEIEKQVASGIFRIYQEALTNITRHSNATLVELFISNDSNKFSVVVKDNGIGFDFSEIKTKKTLGLLGMNERAIMLDGELLIESKIIEGTTITLNVPLKSTSN